jgi:beta-1,4-mannosyltransferase
MNKIKVLVFPKASNPYQDLLYNEIKKNKDINIQYLPYTENDSVFLELLFLPFHLLYFRFKGYKIFHLHWLYPFNLRNKYLSSIICVLYLKYIKLLGYKIVYTIHDLIPHDDIFLSNLFMIKYVLGLSDANIALSKSTIDDIKKFYLKNYKLHLIPIGNYIEIYENNITQKEAREKLNINNNTFVFLFFGRIEPYKGVITLINAFKSISHKKIKLIIVGKCDNANLRNKIIKNINSNIILNLQYIPDRDIQIYFNSADIVVSPFQEITNSSTVLLAASFAKSLIAPKMGALNDLPDTFCTFYDNKTKSLTEAMEEVINNKYLIKKRGKYAINYANNLAWKNIADRTFLLYKELI